MIHCDCVPDPTNIPRPTIKRLSLYLRELERHESDGKPTVNSRQLGASVGITDAQVRKDLSCFGQFGQPGIGYRVAGLVVELQGSGKVDPIPHLTCVNQTRDEVQVILERYASSKVSNLLALRGDAPADDDEYERGDDEYTFAIDLVKHVCRFNESGLHPDPRGFGIGVAGFPEGHPETPNRLKQLGFLKEKVDAGAHWVTTQLFFDNAAFYDWRERCDLIGINVPLVAGIMPLTSMKGLHRMAELAAGTNFPARLQREIYRHQDDPKAVEQVGIEWATQQCRDLLEQEAAGIHFYTLNNSDATMQIFRSLGAKDASGLR